MKNLNCRNCGAPMVIDASAMTAVCYYCGTKYVLNHEDTDYYQKFFMQMNQFLSGGQDEQKRRLRADALWEKADTQTFYCDDGVPIEVKYMHRYEDKDAEVYVARKNIVYHFKRDGITKAENYRRMVSFIDYPSADTRALSDFFPKVTGGFALSDQSNILVVSKDPDEYPLRMFGNLSGRHVAWVISRLENLCCVLQYNSFVHPDLNLDTVFINPYTHQACLYGNWWNAVKNNSYARNERKLLTCRDNLTGLRNTAAQLLGFPNAKMVKSGEGIPDALAGFISSEPKETAYDDFAYWDDMLIKAYGERKFVTMDTDDEQIYKKR